MGSSPLQSMTHHDEYSRSNEFIVVVVVVVVEYYYLLLMKGPETQRFVSSY